MWRSSRATLLLVALVPSLLASVPVQVALVATLVSLPARRRRPVHLAVPQPLLEAVVRAVALSNSLLVKGHR